MNAGTGTSQPGWLWNPWSSTVWETKTEWSRRGSVNLTSFWCEFRGKCTVFWLFLVVFLSQNLKNFRLRRFLARFCLFGQDFRKSSLVGQDLRTPPHPTPPPKVISGKFWQNKPYDRPFRQSWTGSSLSHALQDCSRSYSQRARGKIFFLRNLINSFRNVTQKL